MSQRGHITKGVFKGHQIFFYISFQYIFFKTFFSDHLLRAAFLCDVTFVIACRDLCSAIAGFPQLHGCCLGRLLLHGAPFGGLPVYTLHPTWCLWFVSEPQNISGSAVSCWRLRSHCSLLQQSSVKFSAEDCELVAQYPGPGHGPADD